MSELKLLPCPFCGGESVLLKHNDEDYYKVFCECCGARQWTFANRTDRDAIRNWNTRTPMANIVEKLEENSQYCVPLGGQSFTGIKLETAINIVKQEINNGLE